jgi:hypothetical protein
MKINFNSIHFFCLLLISNFVFGQGKAIKKLPSAIDSSYLTQSAFQEYMDSFSRELTKKLVTLKPESNKEVKELKNQNSLLIDEKKELKKQNDSLFKAIEIKGKELSELQTNLNNKIAEFKKNEIDKNVLLADKKTFFNNYKIPFDSLVRKYSETQIREILVQMENLNFKDDSLKSNLNITLQFWEYQILVKKKFQANQITNAINALDKTLNHAYANNSIECANLSNTLKNYEITRNEILNQLNYISNIYKEITGNPIDSKLNRIKAISYLIKPYYNPNIAIEKIPYLDALLKEEIIRFAKEEPTTKLVDQFKEKL